MVKTTIGNRVFRTKQQAYLFVREKIQEPRTICRECEEWGFFVDLLGNHKTKNVPEDNIKCFRVCKGFFKEPAIYYLNNENERITFSWVDCARCSKTKFNSVLLALRNSITNDVLVFLNNHKKNGCVECGSLTNLEVDHMTPCFKHISDKFLTASPVSEKHIQYVETTHQLMPILREPMRTRWVKFHNECSNLQLLCKRCHRDKTNKREWEHALPILF